MHVHTESILALGLGLAYLHVLLPLAQLGEGVTKLRSYGRYKRSEESLASSQFLSSVTHRTT